MASPTLGILGGTFDPVHVGHLAAASTARHALGLERVLLVVAGDPWQKHDSVVAPAEVRYAMVAAALDGVEGLEASRIEIDRAGPTYTIDTVEALRARGHEVVLILGADAASRLDTWHRAEALRELVTLAVVEREGVPAPSPPPGWRVEPVVMPRLDVSSSQLRARLAAGDSVEFLVPTPAWRVLQASGCYGAG